MKFLKIIFTDLNEKDICSYKDEDVNIGDTIIVNTSKGKRVAEVLDKLDEFVDFFSVDNILFKIVDNEDSNIFVVSFSFKNTSSEPIAFDNLFTTDVTQNGSKLMPTVVNADGINVLSGVELIDPGKKTKVQKTYVITDEENPVEIMVYKYAEPTGDILKKIFNVK